MRRALPSVLPWAVTVTASVAVFAMTRAREIGGGGWVWNSPTGHFWIVSAAAGVCVVLALAAGIATVRTSNPRIVTITISFIAMAGIFAVHGLATPGFLLSPPPGVAQVTASEATSATSPAATFSSDPYDAYGAAESITPETPSGASTEPAPTSRFYNVIGLSSSLAILVSSAFLAIAAAPWPRGLEGWVTRWRVALLAVATLAVLGYAIAGLTAPWLVPTFLISYRSFAWGTMLSVLLLAGFAAFRYGRAYYRSGLQMHGAVAIGAILIMQGQLSMHFGATWSGTFWLYHVQLLAGFLAMFWGILIEYSRGRAVESLDALTVSDVLAQLRSGYAEPIVALSAALEARDGYTLGHGERVAALAVLIGQKMGVSGGRLRGIAAGSLLHDVGKIGVPDSVLHKPEGLTYDEFEIIREHPARGAEMLKRHFDQKVESHVIRHHHERWDGAGYPDGLAGARIPLEARIAAIADVYDALRSNRSYRSAFRREEAIGLIEEGSGSHFDPACVLAFTAVVDRWEALYSDDSQAYRERRVA